MTTILVKTQQKWAIAYLILGTVFSVAAIAIFLFADGNYINLGFQALLG